MRLLDRLSSSTRSALPAPESVAWMSSTWPGQSPSQTPAPTYDTFSANGFMANAVVFACAQARINLLSQVEFKWQDLATRRLFGTPELALLENPWPNGTSGDLLARMEQQNTLAGNAFVRRLPDRLEVLRGDRVEVALATYRTPEGREYPTVIGYWYWPLGIGVGDPEMLTVAEVAHWSPMPDPLNPYRGMSWLIPVLREINADESMTQHRQKFFDNAATPNMMIRYEQRLTTEQLERVKNAWNARHAGPSNSGGTVVLDNGANLTVVGSTMESMQFVDVQSAGENRIALAAGVPPQVVGIKAGLDAGSFANYAQAYKGFATTTMALLWQSVVAALAPLVTAPDGCRLWFDTSRIPALQEAETDRATAASIYATAANTFITAGYEPTSVQNALMADDMSLLKHTGLVSVQLQNPGSAPPVGGTP